MLAWELFDWGVRSFVLLALALVVARVVERRSASLAHCLLVASMGMVLVMPLATWFLPGWGASLWPASSLPPAVEMSVAATPTPSAAVSPAIDGLEMMPIVPEEHSPETFLPREIATTDEPAPIETVPQREIVPDVVPVRVMSGPAVAEASPSVLTVRQVLVVVWCAVAVMLLVRVALALWRLRRLAREGRAAEDPLTSQVRQLARELGIRRDVEIALATADTMPMAFWLGRWRVVLPSNFASWPEPLRTTTLVHELGHVARRDAWSDLLVQVAACVAWPIPPAWLAVRDIRRLRERACDEWTLEKSGLDVKAYAHTLLEVVDRCQRRSVSFAYAMAGRREFESRLGWILARPRVGMPSPWVGRLAVAGVLSLGMAVATAMTGAQESTNTPAGDEPAGEVDMEEVFISAEPTPDEPAISVRGTVVDEAGNPVPGASVVLRPTSPETEYAFPFRHNRDVLARTKTNARGEFQLQKIGVPPRMVDTLAELREGKPAVQLVAWSEGMAIEWLTIAAFDAPDQRLVLERQVEVVGRMTDEEGNPVTDGKVRVTGLTKKTGKLDGFLQERDDLQLFQSELDLGTSIEAGEFILSHMPKDFRILLWCEGTTGERSFILLDTAENNPGEPSTARMENFETQRSPLEIRAKRHPWAKIKVVHREGNPVGGGGVYAVPDDHRNQGWGAAVGSDGTATLIVNDPGTYTVYYSSDPLFPTPSYHQNIDIRGKETLEYTFRLEKPQWLTGKVVDAETGQPITGVHVHAVNGNSKPSHTRHRSSRGVSGRDGRFKVAVGYGDWQLSLGSNVDGYFAPSYSNAYRVKQKPEFSERTISSDAIPDDVTIELARGLEVSGHVFDSEGRPQEGATVQAMNLSHPHLQRTALTNLEGEFRLAGLSPYANTRIVAWGESGAAEHTIEGDSEHPWEQTRQEAVSLQLTADNSVAGRVMRQGRPAADVTVRLLKGYAVPLRSDATMFLKISEVTTDRDGKYVLRGLRRGDRYHLEIESVGNAEVRDWRYQSPYSHIMEAKEGETLELPDAVLVSQGQELSGVVVDTEGRPLGGITVSARLVSGGFLSRTERGPAPWIETDAEGRFHLTHLPDEPITLMAHRRNPAGGTIKYPSYVTPEANATDIRIVIDPRLGQGVENLDE